MNENGHRSVIIIIIYLPLPLYIIGMDFKITCRIIIIIIIIAIAIACLRVNGALEGFSDKRVDKKFEGIIVTMRY